MQGVLTKIGDTFDRLTGRGWKPSSSLATSELAERLKALVDAEAREADDKRRYVPHNIALKMQWDKFSTDSEDSLKRLENELIIALIDHINDRRYYTYAPVSLVVKPDYFTDGVKLYAGFDKADEDEGEASVNVTVPAVRVDLPEKSSGSAGAASGVHAVVRFDIDGRAAEKTFEVVSGGRLSVGRTNENDIALDDASVSKLHASLLLNTRGEMVVADTGSTNGTFLNGERIAYGKAGIFRPGDRLRFGTVEVDLELTPRSGPTSDEVPSEISDSEAIRDDAYRVGEFEFSTKPNAAPADMPAATLPSIPRPDSLILKPLAASETADPGRTMIEDRKKEAVPEQ